MTLRKQKKDNQDISMYISVIGLDSSGKSELMQRYCSDYLFSCEYSGKEIYTRDMIIRNNAISILFTVVPQYKTDLYSEFIKTSHAVLLTFDLTDIKSLESLDDMYKKFHGLNEKALPTLVGTKYELYCNLEDQEKKTITEKVKKFAKDIGSPLIYCSIAPKTNVSNAFRILIGRPLGLKPKIEQVDDYNKPIIMMD